MVWSPEDAKIVNRLIYKYVSQSLTEEEAEKMKEILKISYEDRSSLIPSTTEDAYKFLSSIRIDRDSEKPLFWEESKIEEDSFPSY